MKSVILRKTHFQTASVCLEEKNYELFCVIILLKTQLLSAYIMCELEAKLRPTDFKREQNPMKSIER